MKTLPLFIVGLLLVVGGLLLNGKEESTNWGFLLILLGTALMIINFFLQLKNIRR